MQTTIPQIKRDISHQECNVNGQSGQTYADCTSPVAYQSFLPNLTPPASQTVQYQAMTTIHSTLAQTPQPGKTKWKINSGRSTMQRHSYPSQQQTISSSPVVFSGYSTAPSYPDPRGQHLPPYDPYYYTNQAQHYFPNNYPSGNVYPNGYRPQIQTPQPRPYLTITQFNYQPIGYSPQSQTTSSPSSLVFGPPPRDRRCSVDTRFYSSHLSQQYDMDRPTSPNKYKMLELNNTATQPKVLFINSTLQNNEEKINSLRTDNKSDSSGSFEFTIQPEQIVNSLCDEKDQENLLNKLQADVLKPADDNIGCHVFGSPRMWPNSEEMNPMRIEDDELTKFIVEGCLKAETIAVRNQHRPCFKNIKHLCTRTRTDILKPRTTVANIHSQGIPWATKDFIFAFVRLINCWYILKGYLDDHDGSLGKIETTLTSEFKECYQKWQNNNKEMVRHLINIFVNLDNGITVQNAEIFSTFNQMSGNTQNTSCKFPEIVDNQRTVTSKIYTNKFSQEQLDYNSNKSKLQSQSDIFLEGNTYNISDLFSNDLESCINLKLKHSHSEGRMSVPGILRVKDIFNAPKSTNTSPRNEDDTDSERECRHKIYMKPGSYRVPKRPHLSLQNTSPRGIDIKDTPTTNDQNEVVTNNQSSQETSIDTTPNLEMKALSETLSDIPTPDDAWKSALESIGPFMKGVMQDSESSYESPINCSQHPEKRNLSSESSEKDCEIVENNTKHKCYKNTKDTQAWVQEHSLENCMDENIEEVLEKPKKVDKRTGKSSTKKSYMNTRTYRKKNDDTVLKKSVKCKSSDDNSMNQSNFKKSSEPSAVTNACFLTRRHLIMSSLIISKFEKIINALWNLQFAKYITFEINVENVPEYYKYIRKPIVLCKIMNNLKQNKYSHPYQVVHDLRSIIRTFEKYVEKRPDWWFEKCLQGFSKELESQLAEKFSSYDFSSVTGEAQTPNEDEAIYENSLELGTGESNE